MIEAIASSGSPSQLMRELMMENFQNSQLKTLKVGSNIHFQAKVDSTVGMMKGSRMKARISALPLKWRLSSIARHRPSASLNTAGAPLYQKGVPTPGPQMLVLPVLTQLFRPT